MAKYNADRVIQIESGDTDFGFEIVDNDLDNVIGLESHISLLEDRLKEMRDLIVPLLNNLMKNPEKDTIKWPNRVEKIKPMLDAINKLADPYK